MMIRIGAGCAPMLMFAACGGSDDAGNAAMMNGAAAANVAALAAGIAPPSPTPAAVAGARDPAADQAAVRAAVDAGYAGYRTGSTESGFRRSPEFEAAWTRAVGKGGALDVDPYCKCQDFDAAKFRHTIRTVTLKRDRARVTVDLDLFGTGPGDPIWVELVRTPDGWLVDDVEGIDGSGIKARMRLAEPGSWALSGG